jgi:hypothetical protein
MRKSLWIVPLLLLSAAIGSTTARADTTYSATFTCNSPCTSTPTSPGVTFPTAPGPTAPFSVTWDNITFNNFQLLSGNLPTDSYRWQASGDFIGYGGPIFALIDSRTGDTYPEFGNLSLSNSASDTGMLSFTPVATPEPSSVVLLLAGIGLVFVMRKRWALGLQQPS